MRSPLPHPDFWLAVLCGATLAACGDPGAYPSYEADTGPDLDLIGGDDGGGDGGGGSGGVTLPTLDAPCLTSATACSTGDGEAASIQVVNQSNDTVDLYWVDGACALHFYQTAAPGGTITQSSYATHVWALVDQASGTELGRIETTYPDQCSVGVQ